MAKRSVALEDGDMGETQAELAARQEAAGSAIAGIASALVATARVRALPPRRMQGAATARNDWEVIADPGTTKELIETPSFWTHYAVILRRGDHVWVKGADGSFLAHLYVLVVGTRDVLVKTLNFWPLESVAPDALDVPNGYEIEWGGDLTQFRVLRGTEVLREDLASRAAAATWLRGYLQSLKR